MPKLVSREVEVWCWASIPRHNRGHVELKADRFYTLLPDHDMKYLVNEQRRARKHDAVHGRYEGIMRVVDETDIVSSYDDIYRRLSSDTRNGYLDIRLLRATFGVTEDQYASLLQHLRRFKREPKGESGSEYYSGIEYFYRSEGTSRNCATFTHGALRAAHILDEALPGDGVWPDDFFHLLQQMGDTGAVKLRSGHFSPAHFELEGGESDE